MKKRFFFIGGILLLILIGWSIYLYNKPHSNTAGLEADFRISAADLYAAFQKDEAASNKKFMGKVIEVNGPVAEIDTGSGNTNILISASATGGINCSFSNAGFVEAESPKKGNIITIKGRCTGFLMDVNLVDCVLKE